MSDTDSDGAIGLKHVRAQGGLTIAQNPDEAQFDSMPATAISTGMVDWVLPVSEMPAKLVKSRVRPLMTKSLDAARLRSVLAAA